MTPGNVAFAPVVLPLLGAALAFCARVIHSRPLKALLDNLAAFSGLALPWLVLIGSFPVVLEGTPIEGIIGHWHHTVGISYRYDGLAWLVNVLGYSLSGVAWIYSRGTAPRDPLFTAMLLIQTSALAATIITTDLFNYFVCLELMGITSYVMVAMNDKPEATLASFAYLMVSATAMVFYLVGVYGLYRLTGALSYSGVAEALRSLPDAGGPVATVSLSMIVAAVAIRVAIIPVYGWLPDAHAMAPHAVSAVLSGVLIKTPLFALLRLLILLPEGNRVGLLMSYAGAVTAVAGVVMALAQEDAKRLLAYHSVSQIGYVVSAWGAALHAGIESVEGIRLMSAAYLHALYHAIFKGLLFLTVGTTTDISGNRNVYRLRGAAAILHNHGERLPITVACFAIGALAICAIPPLNGYVSKVAISNALQGTIQYDLLAAAAAGTVGSFIKLSRIYLPQRERAVAEVFPPPVSAPPVSLVPIWTAQTILAVLCIIGGAAASFLYTRVSALLAPGSHTAVTPPVLYSLSNFTTSSVTIMAGTGIFLAATTPYGLRFLRAIRNRPQSFQGLLASFVLGTAALTIWLLF